MEKDLDIKLYNEYLDGNKEAFELLYNKYKEKIQYFIYNIVKDYQKAEDITQDTFVYVMQNKIKEGYTFKYYIYLVAKSRAYNHINTEKKRTEINEKYLSNGSNQVEQDVADIITRNEKRKERKVHDEGGRKDEAHEETFWTAAGSGYGVCNERQCICRCESNSRRRLKRNSDKSYI